jgi:branched-chain amino acid transport system permease protein
VWPSAWAEQHSHFYWLALALCAVGVYLLRRMLFAPLGYALRAARDSALRADALGLDVRRIQWTALVIAGVFAGVAGALFAFSKGSVAPDSLGVTRSVDALVMVLLGGIQTLAGPLVGSAAFTWLHDTVARNTDYWRALLGGIMLLLVLLFPQGIAGYVQMLWARLVPRKAQGAAA